MAAWLADGAASLTQLVIAPAHAEEDTLLSFPEEAVRAGAAPTGAEATAHRFPPPPEVAPANAPATAPVAAALGADTVALAALPVVQPPADTRTPFRAPPDPTLVPAPADEALARRALRTAAAFATPGPVAGPRPAAGRGARLAGEDLEAELRCLALNVYWEARSEPALGRFAVAAVTLNRVANRNFPNTICEVVRQGTELGLHRCQFSWVCDRRGNEPAHDAAWRDAEHVAFAALFFNLPDPTRGALWYHADYVSPPWAGTMAEAMRIGRHLFYRGPARMIQAARGATG